MGRKFVNPVSIAPEYFPGCVSAAVFRGGIKKAGVLAGLLLGMILAASATPFVAGTDFSDLSFFESRGITYKDQGKVQDGIQILKNHGINCVRLRLWTGSDALVQTKNAYNYTNNLTYTLPLAVRVKSAGLLFCLDFHYSDTWADPSHQLTPSAWFSLTFDPMVQQMRTYNSNTIAAFAAAGAMPDYVQIGNEITSGMLFTNSAGTIIGEVTGSTNTAWSQLGQLMKAAVQGIQDAVTNAGTTMPKIIVHIDKGGNWATTLWFYDNLSYQGVPFDIIGESYYPFYQGSPTNLSICLSNAAVRYGKPIVVAEDAFPWTNNADNASWTNQLFGYPPTRAGQVSFIAALARIVKGVPNQLGAGFFYWGAEYQAASGVNEAGFYTSSFFDAGGNVLPVADAVGGMGAPLFIRPALNGSNLQLQWPFSGAAMQLTTSTILGSLAAWSSVTNSPQITGAVFTVTLPVDLSQNHFYRLQSN